MIINLVDENSTRIQLKILFSKTPPGKRRRKHGRELIDTTCRIFDRLPETEKPTEKSVDDDLAGLGIARQSALDGYNKIVGKKIALTRAINKIPYLLSTGCTTKAGIERQSMRQHIWNVFHATFKKWR